MTSSNMSLCLGGPTAGEHRPARSGTSALAGTTALAEGGAAHLLFGSTSVRLVLTGNISQSTQADLMIAVDEAVGAARPVQVDARHVRFMDSSGIALIAHLAQRAASRVTMIQPPDVVRFLLDVTKLGQVIDVTEDDPGLPSC